MMIATEELEVIMGKQEEILNGSDWESKGGGGGVEFLVILILPPTHLFEILNI